MGSFVDPNDTNDTVRAIITQIRDDMAGPFDLNVADEFIDQLAMFVTEAIDYARMTRYSPPASRTEKDTRIADFARKAAYTTLMLKPCDGCGVYIDIDQNDRDEEGFLCDACLGALRANAPKLWR